MSRNNSKFFLKWGDVILFTISLICLIWILLYKLVWIEIDTIFPKADIYAEITYTIFASIIASAIFYLINVYLPQTNRKRILKQPIQEILKRFAHDAFFITNDILSKAKCTTKYNDIVPRDVFIEACKRLKLHSAAPLIFNNPRYQPKDWFEYFAYYIGLERSNINILLQFYKMQLPDSVNSDLLYIFNNNMHAALNTYKINPQYDFPGLASVLYEHIKIMHELPKKFERDYW